MSDTLTMALAQLDPMPNDLPGSISRLCEQAEQAKAKGASLLLTPEMCMTGYELNLETLTSLAEPADGNLSAAVAEICKTYSMAIAYGFGEQADNQIFNSVQLIDATGERCAVYRKTHLWGDMDNTLFTQGASLTKPVNIDGWNVGLLICYDVEFPECTRSLSLAGADVVLVATGLMEPNTYIADQLISARAFENQTYVAYANYCGEDPTLKYVGRSSIVGPDGVVLAKAKEEPELLIATMSKAAIARERKILPYHRDRRPELYSL